MAVNRSQAFVYVIKNKQNNKEYVGSTNDFERRVKDHLRLLRKDKHYNRHLQNAYNYSSDCFEFKLIGTFENREDAFAFEQLYLDTHELLTEGYNQKQDVKCSSKFGNGLKGRVLSESHKDNMRKPRPHTRGINNSKRASEFYQYCKFTKELLATWNVGIRECARMLNLNRKAISENLSGRNKSCSNFIFTYIKLNILEHGK